MEITAARVQALSSKVSSAFHGTERCIIVSEEQFDALYPIASASDVVATARRVYDIDDMNTWGVDGWSLLHQDARKLAQELQDWCMAYPREHDCAMFIRLPTIHLRRETFNLEMYAWTHYRVIWHNLPKSTGLEATAPADTRAPRGIRIRERVSD